jgi:hypothetical protein
MQDLVLGQIDLAFTTLLFLQTGSRLHLRCFKIGRSSVYRVLGVWKKALQIAGAAVGALQFYPSIRERPS